MSLVKTLIFISGALEFAPFELQSQPLTQTVWDPGHSALRPGKHISSTWLTSFSVCEGLCEERVNTSQHILVLFFFPFSFLWSGWKFYSFFTKIQSNVLSYPPPRGLLATDSIIHSKAKSVTLQRLFLVRALAFYLLELCLHSCEKQFQLKSRSVFIFLVILRFRFRPKCFQPFVY